MTENNNKKIKLFSNLTWLFTSSSPPFAGFSRLSTTSIIHLKYFPAFFCNFSVCVCLMKFKTILRGFKCKQRRAIKVINKFWSPLPFPATHKFHCINNASELFFPFIFFSNWCRFHMSNAKHVIYRHNRVVNTGKKYQGNENSTIDSKKSAFSAF
jgi:hypothetical protein